MAHGSETARDLRYGRRGGGWQSTTARDALDQLAAHRARYPDLWPDVTIADHVFDGEHATPDDWAGRARMAAARHAANLDLDPTDIEALRRHPTNRGATP